MNKKMNFFKDASLVGRFAGGTLRWWDASLVGFLDSIKNQGVFDTHDFSWKGVYFGGFK